MKQKLKLKGCWFPKITKKLTRLGSQITYNELNNFLLHLLLSIVFVQESSAVFRNFFWRMGDWKIVHFAPKKGVCRALEILIMGMKWAILASCNVVCFQVVSFKPLGVFDEASVNGI